MSQSPVAIYGLGNMGYPLAERIGRKFPTLVHDLNEAQLARAQQAFNGKPIRDAGGAGEHAGRRAVPAQPGGLARGAAADRPRISRAAPSSWRPARSIPRTSTPARSCCRRTASTWWTPPSWPASARWWLAPRRWRSVVPREAIGRAQPVLDAIATKQVYFGGLGAGAAAKVINNAVAHAVMIVVAEAGAWPRPSGVDCQKMIAMLSDAQMGLQRPLTYRYADRIVKGDYEGGMPLDAARKDSVLALQLAQNLNVPLFAIQGSHSVYDMAAAAGYGRDDYAAVAKLWADWGCPTVPSEAG